MKRVCILLSLQRAGSNPIGQIIGEYLKQNEGYEYFHEYLCPGYGKIAVAQNNLINFKFEVNPEPWLQGPEEAEQIRRWGLLAKSPQKIFFKTFPQFLDQVSSKWLTGNADIIYIYRRNIFDHLLSYMISMQTDLWYEPNGIQLPERSLVGSMEVFLKFCRIYKKLEARRQKEKNPKIIFYEDFVTNSRESLLQDIGFKKPVDWANFFSVAKQNNGPKLNLFSNPDEIIGWYQQSPFKSIAPLELTAGNSVEA